MKIIYLLWLLPIFAEAAPRVNNGGGAWACRTMGETQWIQAADFFEPESRGREEVGAATTNEIFARKAAEIASRYPELHKLLQKSPVDFGKVIQFVDFPLSNTEDMNFGSRPQPSECEGGDVAYEQVAVYLYDNTLLISKPVWSQLPPLDQAAILFHEWIYKALRDDRDEQTSNRTRLLVAALFSGADPAAIEKIIQRELQFSSHDQLEDELATFPVAPRCEAIVDGEVVGSWQARGERFGETASFHGGGFTFTVETSPRDGVPGALSVIEERGGWKFSQSAKMSRATFLRLKKSELRISQGDKEILFWCWNQI